MKTIVGFDPGLATGYVCCVYDEDTAYVKIVDAKELDLNGVYDLVSEMEKSHVTDVTIVCEAFIITTSTAKKTPAPWSLEIIGLLKWLAYVKCWDFKLTTASNAKGMVTNDRLREWDLWVVGSDHVRDAMRQVAHHLVTACNMHKVLKNRGNK